MIISPNSYIAMIEKGNRGLFRFSDFYKRLAFETRLERSFNNLSDTIENAQTAGEDLEELINEILYGQPLGCDR